jgi:hypothetical protein
LGGVIQAPGLLESLIPVPFLHHGNVLAAVRRVGLRFKVQNTAKPR